MEQLAAGDTHSRMDAAGGGGNRPTYLDPLKRWGGWEMRDEEEEEEEGETVSSGEDHTDLWLAWTLIWALSLSAVMWPVAGWGRIYNK